MGNTKQYRYNKYGNMPGGGPPNPRRAQLLASGCIRNYPSTFERRALGLIGEHVYTPPKDSHV